MRVILRTVLIPLVFGWLAALIFGVWIARLEFSEISTSTRINPALALLIPPTQPRTIRAADLFAPDHIAVEYAARINDNLRSGAALLIPQSGVVAALLVWQVILTARHTATPRQQGIIAGGLVGVVEGIAALLLQASWPIAAVLAALMLGAGAFGGWSVASKTEAIHLTP